MKLTIEPTDEMVEVNGAPCRVWKGSSDGGVVSVVLFVAGVAVPDGTDLSTFDADLFPADAIETRVPKREN